MRLFSCSFSKITCFFLRWFLLLFQYLLWHTPHIHTRKHLLVGHTQTSLVLINERNMQYIHTDACGMYILRLSCIDSMNESSKETSSNMPAVQSEPKLFVSKWTGGARSNLHHIYIYSKANMKEEKNYAERNWQAIIPKFASISCAYTLAWPLFFCDDKNGYKSRLTAAAFLLIFLLKTQFCFWITWRHAQSAHKRREDEQEVWAR